MDRMKERGRAISRFASAKTFTVTQGQSFRAGFYPIRKIPDSHSEFHTNANMIFVYLYVY